MGSHRGSATVMPITTLEARLVARDVERGLCGFVWGSWSAWGGEGSAEGSAWCAHITLDDSRGVQRNSSMQFVGSHNLTSSPKAGC